MNNEEFVRYLYAHRGEARVGNPETLHVANQMVEKGLLRQVGALDGKPIFRVTEQGAFFVQYAMKKLGETPKEKAKSFRKNLGKAVDGYIQDYKAENPVGMEDLRRAFGWWDGPSSNGVRLPPVEPMTLREENEKKLPKPKTKERNYVVVDGVKYYEE